VTAGLLSDLSKRALALRAWSCPFPKWATLCRLRAAGLPVLDAAFVPPSAGPRAVDDAVRALSERLEADRLLVRSDGGLEGRTYYRGGHTLDLDEAARTARQLLTQGRAVILMEPTNRWANRLNMNIGAVRQAPGYGGSMAIEFLGPGYDGSDLNRGGILPQAVFRADVEDWRVGRPPPLATTSVDWLDGAREERRRRATRLERRAREMREPGAGAALQLPVIQDELLLRLCRDVCAVVPEVGWGWRSLSISCCELEDGRQVYWDIVDGNRKYG
jgi:hypothetical protein